MNKGSFFMRSSFLFVRHPFLGPVGSHPPGKRAGSPASLPVCLFPSMPVCRQASIRAGIPTIPPAKENDFRQGCVSLLLRGSIWRCRGSLWRSLATLSTAFPGVWPIETASALCLSTKPLPVCLCAGRHKGWRTGRQVGKDVSPEAGRRADRFACKGKGLSQRLYPFAVAWQHLALSWQLVAFFTRPYRHSSCVWLVAVIWHFHHSDACMPACRQAGTRASRLAGR